MLLKQNPDSELYGGFQLRQIVLPRNAPVLYMLDTVLLAESTF